MELEQIRVELKSKMKASRYLHSIGVEEVSHDLALIYNYDSDKAVLAGILHDCAKFLTDEELLMECKKYQLPVTEIEGRCPFLLHAKVGAAFAQYIYGVEDKDILNAITYHTTGRPAMSLLEKIVFLADYIEPGRKPLPRIQKIREAAYMNLDLAVYMTLDNVLKYLMNTNREVDCMAESALLYYKELLE
jgi:predicted HD superfamily hydrolase involved in NAD metabolism